jgi:hypothetical protein
MILDSLNIEELVLEADKSYLRFDYAEWYKYELGNISFIRNPEWLEIIYQDLKKGK